MSSISQKISGKIGELSCNSSGNSVFEAVFYASFKSSCMDGGGGGLAASSLFRMKSIGNFGIKEYTVMSK